MKKVKLVGIGLIFCLFISSISIFGGHCLFSMAEEDASLLNAQKMSVDVFGNKKIKATTYLYSFNGEPDFIYVDYEDYGYAIFLRQTGELLEYASTGSLEINQENLYYGGPTNYYIKENNQYTNVSTGEPLFFSSIEKEVYSQELLNIFTSNAIKNEYAIDLNDVGIQQTCAEYNTGDSIPSLDQEGYIGANSPQDSSTYYISNFQYFLSNPQHGNNSTGTCGAVAAQLLLSYNNYYNDRRIIEDQYLNGTKLYNPEYSPNYCKNPTTMNRKVLGSSGFNETDTGSYFNLLVQQIPSSATTSQVVGGINDILDDRKIVDYETYCGRADKENIEKELNEDRPLILLMQKSLGGSDHYVVAYGYQDIVSPTNNQTYSGYITHFGHSGETPYRLNIWINSAWCSNYITLKINHTHNYNLVVDNYIDGQFRELKCEECGHRTVDTLYAVDSTGTAIRCLKYSLTEPMALKIPDEINGVKITSIAYSAFCGNTFITGVTLSDGIKHIGTNAFEGCTGLTNLIFPSSVTSIDDEAFQNCYNIQSVTFKQNSCLKAIGDCAFNNCYSIQRITFADNSCLERIGKNSFKNCYALTYVCIPKTVTTIGSMAFYNCINLAAVDFEAGSQLKSLGDRVFIGCSEFYGISIPDSIQSIGAFAFSQKSVTLPMGNFTMPNQDSIFSSSVATIYTEFESQTCEWADNWNSKYTVFWNCSLSSDKTYVVSFIKTANNLNIRDSVYSGNAPYRSGYIFGGWSLTPDGTEVAYTADNVYTAADGTTLYAIWIGLEYKPYGEYGYQMNGNSQIITR